MIAVRFSVLSFRIDLALLSSYLFSVFGGVGGIRTHFHALPLQLRKQLRGSFFLLFSLLLLIVFIYAVIVSRSDITAGPARNTGV